MASTIPCAACKHLKIDCTPSCVFAPHFPSTEPMKFERVHKVFGAENVYAIIDRCPEPQRGEAAAALCYEAEARIKDPLCGYVGTYWLLENHLNGLNSEIQLAKFELARMGITDVPTFNNSAPMPDDFLNSQSELSVFVERFYNQEGRVVSNLNVFTDRRNGEGSSGASSSSAGPSNGI